MSDQENEDTCASHAVGKAIVEIIDGFRIDSDQENIIDELIKTVQPGRQATFIREFANKSIEIEIWSPGSRYKSRIVTISICVQSETINHSNWVGPKMTPQELKAKNTRVVAVWKRKNTTVHSYHAVYVKNITKSPGKTEFILDCVNSWGTQDPNPQISNRDISSLHYISLYMDTTLLVTSAGPSAEYRGDMLGVYKEAGTHNNYPYYKQVDTERKDEEEEVIYRSKAGGWVMGPGLDGPYAGLKHESNTESVPLSGWSCYDGDKYSDDPHLRISPDLPPACGEITITASGEAAVQEPECIGVYTPTQMFSAGKRVFKHQTQERYLFVQAGYTEWGVRKSVESKGAMMRSGCVPSMCPADPRARTSERMSWTSWQCGDGAGGWIHGDITVKCSVHKY